MKKYDFAIQIFNEIRDLPYHISTKGETGCDCEDKTKKFIAELKKLNIPARRRIGLFQWSVLSLPEDITRISHDIECSHTFAEVQNAGGDWIFVDPTWNKELRAAGLEIADWDGVRSTALAMECYKILSPEDTTEYANRIDYELDMKNNAKFYEAINKYCYDFLK